MIKLFTLADYNKWNDIVRSFKTYDVYYLSGYARAFEQNGDEKAVLIYFEKEDTRAINVVMKRDIADCDEFKTEIEQDKYCDFVTPYGYGGWIVEGEDYCSLKEEYEQFARRNGIVPEFVRFHPMIRNWENLGDIYEEGFHGKTIFIDTSSEEIIWNNFTSQNRGKVRKAKKNGLKVYWSRDDRILDEFLDVYSETMDKDCAKNYYYFDRDFFESVMEDLKYNAMWFMR